jgi:hypothetical protein
VAKTKASTTRTAADEKHVKITRRATAHKGAAGKDATNTHAPKKATVATHKKTTTEKSARTTCVSKHPKLDDVVLVDRRVAADRRNGDDRRKEQKPVVVERRKLERRAKVCRRRQIDPTTCERDYTSEELDFMSALDEYKRTSGRMFPTCSEILEVIRGLGYQKVVSENGPSPAAASQAGTPRGRLNETFPSPPLGELPAGSPLAGGIQQ